MNETLKTFTEDLAKELKAKLQSADYTDFIDKVKASGDDRTFEVVMSTSDEDRQGDSLDQTGWDLKYYNLNPVVLWAHNYSSFPIGIVTDITIDGDKAVATGKFAPAGINPEADMACALYQQKILRTVSPGYIQNDDGTRELLEISFCPVPAGRYALSLRQVGVLGVSTQELITKGFFFETRGVVPFKSHGIADPDEPWDGPAEVKACGDDLDKLKAICAWFDSENADTKSAYKLPHHRASDLKAVWKGVSAAAAALQGSRGGVDVPEKDVAGIKTHLAKHYEEFGKTPPWDEKSEKASRVGDHCELEDGTPGALAEDAENPGRLVCVPVQDKSTTMENELTKKLKAEHKDHGEAVGKGIDGLSESVKDDHVKAIEEFKGELDTENERHHDACMKAIDDSYEDMGREDGNGKKSQKDIEEFKKGFEDEHGTHTGNLEKAIETFTKDWPDGDPKENEPAAKKAIETFTKSAGDELERHQQVHMDMCKAEADRMGEGEDDEAKAISAGIVKELNGKSEFSEAELSEILMKAGRAISAANKDKIASIIKALQEHHTAQTTEHEKSTNDVIASLKELISSPQEDEGKETQDGKSAAPNSRSRTSGAPASKKELMSELDAYLLAQRLARQIKSASEDGLRQINETLRKKYPGRKF